MRILTLQDFAAVANQGFALAVGGASLTLSLVQVTPLAPAVHRGQMRQPFSLLFKAASPVLLPQRLYTLAHDTMGRIDIFLVPIAREPDGIVYQAVFN